MHAFVANIELILTVLGLMLIATIPSLVSAGGADFWRATAIIATTVGAVHGLLFWFIRRHQRAIRHEMLHNTRDVLQGIVDHHSAVSVMASSADPSGGRPDAVRDAVQQACAQLTIVDTEPLRRPRSSYKPAQRTAARA